MKRQENFFSATRISTKDEERPYIDLDCGRESSERQEIDRQDLMINRLIAKIFLPGSSTTFNSQEAKILPAPKAAKSELFEIRIPDKVANIYFELSGKLNCEKISFIIYAASDLYAVLNYLSRRCSHMHRPFEGSRNVPGELAWEVDF